MFTKQRENMLYIGVHKHSTVKVDAAATVVAVAVIEPVAGPPLL